jgi:hypothetical protein
MKTTMRWALPAVAAAALLALGACTLPAAQAQVSEEAATDRRQGITVTGTGSSRGTPDVMVVNLGVSVVADGVGQATSEASQLAADVIAAVRDQGVAQEDIQTSDYSIYPEYDYSGQRERIVGYRVTNMLQVTVRDIDQSGAVIDAATAAGGDASQVGGVSLVIEDDAGLIQQARESAWEDATVKAEQLADLAGVTLGAPISITETTASLPPMIPYADEAAAQDAARTPIEAGRQNVEVTVNVVFSIEG